MTHFIAAFYALIFSFCHATSVRHTEAQMQPAPAALYGAFVPPRVELARGEFAARYAGAACLSCARTNVVYNER